MQPDPVQKPQALQTSGQQPTVFVAQPESHQQLSAETPPQYPAQVPLPPPPDTQAPLLQLVPGGQDPQDPPHPSFPQVFPEQLAVHPPDDPGQAMGFCPDGSAPDPEQLYQFFVAHHPHGLLSPHSRVMSSLPLQNLRFFPSQQPVLVTVPQGSAKAVAVSKNVSTKTHSAIARTAASLRFASTPRGESAVGVI